MTTYDAGYDARQLGEPRDSNPHLATDAEHVWWNDGWDQAEYQAMCPHESLSDEWWKWWQEKTKGANE